MSQIKIYAQRSVLTRCQPILSAAIHQSLVEAIHLPVDKKFQRFIALDADSFIYPDDRSENYTIIEISMFEGRSVDSKKRLIDALFTHISQQCGIAPQDIEITIFETPKENWGIRGKVANELTLNYQVNV